jgi:hypothetical protein
VLGDPGDLGPRGERGLGGNFVVVASDDPLPLEGIEAANRRRGEVDEILHGDQLLAFVGDARVLTDDHAPVDQLLTPVRDR